MFYPGNSECDFSAQNKLLVGDFLSEDKIIGGDFSAEDRWSVGDFSAIILSSLKQF